MTVIRRIIMSLPVKSCCLDPMPSFLLREMVDVPTPFVTTLVNASLSQCWLPDSQKHAIVSPLLKKPGMDMANFRPVSNLSFLSKVTERVVAQRLKEYLTENSLLPRCQSACRRHHSTETAGHATCHFWRYVSCWCSVRDAAWYRRLVGSIRLRRSSTLVRAVTADVWSD